MIARKLDTTYTVTDRMIRRHIRQFANQSGRPADPAARGSLARNFSFNTGSGTGGGNPGGTGNGGAPQIVADSYAEGVKAETTRRKLSNSQGVFIQDDSANDRLNLVSDPVNDPMFWMRF